MSAAQEKAVAALKKPVFRVRYPDGTYLYPCRDVTDWTFKCVAEKPTIYWVTRIGAMKAAVAAYYENVQKFADPRITRDRV